MNKKRSKHVYGQLLKMQASLENGYLKLYRMFDGKKNIGFLTVHGVKNPKRKTCIYSLGNADYASRRDFIAAYEATLPRLAA